MKLLFKEFKNFSKQNWWIYIIFFVSLFFIYKTNSGNLLEISLVFAFHFLGDLFIMMMGNYYKQNQNKKALFSQLVTFIIFTIIGIYAGLYAGKWSYLLPQLLFVWPIIKGFFKIKFIDYKFVLIVGIFVFSAYYKLGLIYNIGVLIQILGFTIFPIALILDSKIKKYFLSLVAIFCIFLGSFVLLYNGFIYKNIIGADLSYTLLPFTVFIFYLKELKYYLKLINKKG